MHLLKQLFYRITASLRVFQEKGLRAGFVELGRTVGRILYQRSEHVIVAHTLSEQAHLPEPRPGLTIRQVKTRDEVACLASVVDAVDMARFYKMFDCGSTAFVALANGEPAGCCWFSEQVDRSVNRVQPPLRPGDACVHDLFVSPAHRNQGIGQALITHRLRFLREHGYKRALAAVLKGNTAAFRLDERSGYTHIGKMFHTRILFWDSFKYDLSDDNSGGGHVQPVLSDDKDGPSA